MQLYYAPHTISIAVANALEEAGLVYEAIKIDYAEKQQTTQAYQIPEGTCRLWWSMAASSQRPVRW